MGGADPSEGRLEVCINNAWGSVCDNQFTKEEAIVACYQLDPLYNPGRDFIALINMIIDVL